MRAMYALWPNRLMGIFTVKCTSLSVWFGITDGVDTLTPIDGIDCVAVSSATHILSLV